MTMRDRGTSGQPAPKVQPARDGELQAEVIVVGSDLLRGDVDSSFGSASVVSLLRAFKRHDTSPDPNGEATAIVERIIRTVRDEWRPTMRRAGVSEGDCDSIQSAFVYDGLFYESAA